MGAVDGKGEVVSGILVVVWSSPTLEVGGRGPDDDVTAISVVQVAVEGRTAVSLANGPVEEVAVLDAEGDVDELESEGPTVTPPTVMPVEEDPGQFSVIINVVGPVG